MIHYDDPRGELTLATPVENTFTLLFNGRTLRPKAVLAIDAFLPNNEVHVTTPIGSFAVHRSMVRPVTAAVPGTADCYPL